MIRLSFVACSKTKAASPMPAAALYTSPLFRKSLLAALDNGKKTYILSAKHGVLSCNDIIEPYDVTLKTLSRAARAEWGRRVGDQLARLVDQKTSAAMFCGEEYIAPIRTCLEEKGAVVETPLIGRSLGQRLQDLAVMNREIELRVDVARFYRLIRALWLSQEGGRLLAESSGKLSWPARGVYFIIEMPGGLAHSAMPRIVRVGTHAISAGSRTSLWDRLSTHRGTQGGGGSHRSSIFRSHVGHAIMNRDQGLARIKSWSIGQSAPREIRDTEAGLEAMVSEAIGRLRVIWLDVPDDAGPQSDRAYFERNSIGLLSRSNLLSPLKYRDWLGRFSRDWRICVSGLWNLDHVFSNPDPQFLNRLSDRIVGMIGPSAITKEKVGPRVRAKKQLNLFEGAG